MLTWFGVVRLGLVQACIGAVVVLTTSTLNRVMVVEHALPALLPGVLVALHYAVQIIRPRMGFGADVGGKSTPWILGGMILLAISGFIAALATTMMGSQLWLGVTLALLAFVGIGVGVSACGTSLLTLLAKRVSDERKAPAATIVWIMMIVGFALTAGTAGHFLGNYSADRLLLISAIVSSVAVTLSVIALYRLEESVAPTGKPNSKAQQTPVPFKEAFTEVWAEPVARRFTIFVFVAMLAFNSQDLILEPFLGAVFGLNVGESTKIAGLQNVGILVGMIVVALASARRIGTLRMWTVGGCIASAVMLAGLVFAGLVGFDWPIRANVFLLGVANGMFSIAAIGSMMRLATQGKESREGTRMGLWGAAQALAFGAGGLVGTGASDLSRWSLGNTGTAYAAVFCFEAVLFLISALLAFRLSGPVPNATLQKVQLNTAGFQPAHEA